MVAPGAPGARTVLPGQQWMPRLQALHRQPGKARVGQPELLGEGRRRRRRRRRFPGVATGMAGQLGAVVDRRDPAVAIIQPDPVALPERMAADRTGVGDPPGLFGGQGRAGGGRVSRIEASAHELLELVTQRGRGGRRGSRFGFGLGVGRGPGVGLGRGLGVERVVQRPCERAGDRRGVSRSGRVGPARLVAVVLSGPGQLGLKRLGEAPACVRWPGLCGRGGRRGSLVGFGFGVGRGFGVERVAQRPRELAGDRRRRGRRRRADQVPVAPLAPGQAGLERLGLKGLEEVPARAGLVHSLPSGTCSKRMSAVSWPWICICARPAS
jgi:hypothetical protein